MKSDKQRIVQSFDDEQAMEVWLNSLPPVYIVRALCWINGYTVIVERAA